MKQLRDKFHNGDALCSAWPPSDSSECGKACAHTHVTIHLYGHGIHVLLYLHTGWRRPGKRRLFCVRESGEKGGFNLSLIMSWRSDRLVNRLDSKSDKKCV